MPQEVNAGLSIKDRIYAAWQDARVRHYNVQDVAAFLDKRYEAMRGQYGAYVRAAENSSIPPEHAQIGRDGMQRILDEMEAFFSKWRDYTAAEALSYIGAASMVQPPQLSDAELFDMRMNGLRKLQGIVFAMSGSHLTVRPQSKLDGSDRTFIELNKARIIERIQHEADTWILK